MRVKAKTWGVLGQRCLFCLRTRNTTHNSQLQTVLITASGPQASNALVHRERYTQGSRQNRCVSSQEALALRAKVKGNRGGQCPLAGGRPVVAVRRLALCARGRRPFGVCEGYLPEARGQPHASPWHPTAAGQPPARVKKLPTQNCLRRGIQLYN